MHFHRKPITFIRHVHLKVRDLTRSLAFYQEIIGFKVLNQTDHRADLTADGKNVLLTIEQPDNVIPLQGRTTGLYHFALLLPSRDDLARIVLHFANLGIRLGSADHLVSEALYLSDPDGNGIEIYRDRDPVDWTWQQDQVDMTTDPLNFEDLLSGVQQNQSWKGLPAETVMGHIHLHVSELRRTEEFYTKGLGFDVVNRYGPQALFVSAGKYHHHIGLNTWNGIGAPIPPENSVGLQSYTIVYANEEVRNHIVENLKQIGASVTEEDGQFATADPSGNRILLAV